MWNNTDQTQFIFPNNGTLGTWEYQLGSLSYLQRNQKIRNHKSSWNQHNLDFQFKTACWPQTFVFSSFYQEDNKYKRYNNSQWKAKWVESADVANFQKMEIVKDWLLLMKVRKYSSYSTYKKEDIAKEGNNLSCRIPENHHSKSRYRKGQE